MTINASITSSSKHLIKRQIQFGLRQFFKFSFKFSNHPLLAHFCLKYLKKHQDTAPQNIVSFDQMQFVLKTISVFLDEEKH